MRNFEVDKAEILGGIFDVLSKAMNIYPNIKLKNLPRMADFARWGYAIGEALGSLGNKFLEEYTGNRQIQNEEAIACDPVATLIVEFMRDRNYWSGLCAELYKKLSDIAPDHGINTSEKNFPSDAIRLAKRFKQIKSNLEAVGLQIEKIEPRKDDGQHYSLKRVSLSTVTTVITEACNYEGLATVDKNGEISTRGLKLNDNGTKKESSIIGEMVFDVNTEYFETQYASHGYISGYEFAKAFYAEVYKMAVAEVGNEKYVLSATMHADERNKGLSEKLGKDVYHYHLHVVYIPVTQKEIKWTKKCKDPKLIGTVKEVINQVSHSNKWGCDKEIGADGKEHLVYSYSKLQDRYHDHMKEAGFKNFERGKIGSTAQHLSVLDYKTEKRKEELAEKEAALQDKNAKLNLATVELEEMQSEFEHILEDKNSLILEKEELEKVVMPIKELQKLKTKTAEIKIPDKPVFGSNVKIPYEDLIQLKETSDAYIANEKEIKDIRKRRSAISKREVAATEKEENLAEREKILSQKETLLAEASKTKTDRDNYKNQIGKLQKDMAFIKNEKELLTEKLNEAYKALQNITLSVGLLKYDFEKSPDYKIENLNPKQSTMIDAIANYGARLAEKNNFIQLAESMKKHIDLHEDVKVEMRKINPNIFNRQQKSRSSYDYSR